ncbi:MAG: peptidase M14 family protein, partial [bacterium]
NMDEGWTRLILEQFEFPYKTVLNPKIRKGNLNGDFDVIILPDMKTKQIIEGRKKEKPDIYTPEMPRPYQSGITDEGVENLKAFVEKGGTLITLDSACDFAIEKLGLPVENVLKEVQAEDFFCPGSLLEIYVDNAEPIGYGMPTKAAAMIVNSPAFLPKAWARRTGVVAHYPQYNPLLSGWILGEEKIRSRCAVLDVPMGEGRVVLIGFKAQNRAQTHGTYKFLFNAIQLSCAEEIVLEK